MLKKIEKAAQGGYSGATYVISAGNGAWNGQVGIGCLAYRSGTVLRHKANISLMDDGYSFSIPSPYSVHRELLDLTKDKEEEAMSCADRAAQNVQYLVTNNLSASLALNYVNLLLRNFGVVHTETYPKGEDRLLPITIGTTYFNSKSNGFSSKELVNEYLSQELI